MKAILIGILAILVSIASLALLQDATPSLFFMPVGIAMIVNGFRYGDRCLENEFWRDKE